MTNLTKQLTFLLLFTFCTTSLFSQEVYPGDVNNNGIANVVDLLYLGVAYGNTGPERDDEGTNWEAYTVDPWGQSFPNGLNYAFADCDGDGEIGDDDIEDAIVDNFGMQHGTIISDSYNNDGEPFNTPILKLVPNVLFANEGTTVTFDVVLGSEELPVNDFYGIAFTMSFDADFTQDEDNTTFEFSNNTWLDPSDDGLVRSMAVFDNSGHGEIGISRINQEPISNGFGIIGTFSIIIEDDIASTEIDTFSIFIDSIKMIGPSINTSPMFPRDTFVLITNDTILSSSQIEKEQSVNVYPNPTNRDIHLESTLPFKEIAVYNSSGEKIHAQNFSNTRLSQKLSLKSNQISNGVYFLMLETDEGILTEQFIFQQ